MRVPTTIQHLHESLDYHAARHNLLTANLAHVDTPGFKPKDLARMRSTGATFGHELAVAMTATAPAHHGISAKPSPGRVIDDPTATGPDGNGVSLDREAMKIATNTIRYDLVSALASAELGTWNWAVNDGRGG